MSEEWTRPAHIPYPNVWHEFQAKDIDGENLIKYRVQDFPEDRFEEGINFMVTHFLRDEPFCRGAGILSDPVSVQEFRVFWGNMLKDRIALVCFREGSDEICGMNMISVSSTNEKPFIFETTRALKAFNAVMYMYKKCKVYERFNVDKYIGAFGLVIDPKYRQRGIATELLKARQPLLQAIHIPITITAFTALASQLAAFRAGYQEVSVDTYNELRQAGYDFSDINEESAKTMILTVDTR